MASRYPGATEKRRARLTQEVQWFFCNVQDPCYCGEDEGLWKYFISWDESENRQDKDRYGHTQYYPFLCDWFLSEFEDYCYPNGYRHVGEREPRFAEQLHCCIRAGIDMASEQSAGVAGFTVGNLRSFFDGEVPEWVSAGFEPPLELATNDEKVWL